jgi:hypothetical protein
MTTATAAPASNGRARRSLNDTISQLDQMIDGLSEAIPATVKDCIQDAVPAAIAEGVKAAVLEVLSNPAFLAQVRGPNSGPARPTLRERMTKVLAKAKTATARWVRSAVGRVAAGAGTIAAAAYGQRAKLGLVWRLRKPLLVALGVGLAAALVTAAAPGWVAATVSGVGETCTSLAIQAWVWVRRAVRPVALPA